MYRVYASVLTGWLNEEIEGKGLLYGAQVGFRSGMGVLDNIYALNYLVNREISRPDGR